MYILQKAKVQGCHRNGMSEDGACAAQASVRGRLKRRG
jgi:hypothetical protein